MTFNPTHQFSTRREQSRPLQRSEGDLAFCPGICPQVHTAHSLTCSGDAAAGLPGFSFPAHTLPKPSWAPAGAGAATSPWAKAGSAPSCERRGRSSQAEALSGRGQGTWGSSVGLSKVPPPHPIPPQAVERVCYPGQDHIPHLPDYTTLGGRQGGRWHMVETGLWQGVEGTAWS